MVGLFFSLVAADALEALALRKSRFFCRNMKSSLPVPPVDFLAGCLVRAINSTHQGSAHPKF
jgi:hypothetical protein